MFFFEKDILLCDIDKDLFYKSAFWFLNSEEYWDVYGFSSSGVVNYLALLYDDKVVKSIEYMIDHDIFHDIIVMIDSDLGIIDFLVSKCILELSMEYYDKFIKNLIRYAYVCVDNMIENYGIKFFRCTRKNNILFLLLHYLHEREYIYQIIYLSIKTNQTEIIDCLLKYGLEKNEGMLVDHEYELLISLIKNDNIETFLYVIQNINISNMLIQKMIEGFGEFITREYVKILLNNGKLDLDNLKLLKKSIENNPDKKLKIYVRDLIKF